MTTTTAEHAAAAPRRPSIAIPAWMREPLLHFLVLGAVLFAVDHFVSATRNDPRVIVIDRAVDAQARQVFIDARGHEPTPPELQALRKTWLDNEILYREGLALQVDRGDQAIRERVIFKALSIIDAGIEKPMPKEDVVRAWFEKNRDRYDEPMRFDFQEAVLSGDASEAAARAFVARLNGGESGDAGAGLRVFKGRPRSNVEQAYGPEFAAALEAASPGEWQAYRTKDGWRAMRLQAVSPAKPADFRTLAGVVTHDWIDATAAERRTAAVRALAAKYRIRYEGVTP